MVTGTAENPDISLRVRSQSMIKDLERKDGCPFKFYHRWYKNAIPFKSSEVMDYGRYFETLVIGGSGHDEGLKELPLLKSGKKSAVNLRIDEQAEYAKGMLFDPDHPDYLGFEVTGTQVKLRDDDANYEGIADIIGERFKVGPVLVDLKLAGDVNATFGPYPWGAPWDMDFLQQTLYSYLFQKQFGVIPENILIVFDFSANMGKKVITIKEDERTRDILFDRIDSFEEALKHYGNNGFTKFPSRKECEGCPFEDIGCDTPFTTDKVNYIDVEI
jgi:hypothetical protein